MWGPDAPPLPPTTALRQLLIVVSGFVAVGFAIKALTPDPPAVRREYPYGGLIKELGGLEENQVSTITSPDPVFAYGFLTQARPEINEADN